MTLTERVYNSPTADIGRVAGAFLNNYKTCMYHICPESANTDIL